MKTAEEIKKFVFAGNATFTIQSKKTNKHYSFRFRKNKKDLTSHYYRNCGTAGHTSPTFWVSVCTGGGDQYTYLGAARWGQPFVALTKASKFGVDAPVKKALDFFLKGLDHGVVSGDLNVFHAGRCGRCGRELTDPVSIERGIGPECVQLMEKGK